ncbi:nodulin MtN21 /EamA-like transporter family protein [Actinidia rufa]|uniref:Nodulin MtN21 /EamA-like transporter family protein n=1 Tax=Actinidia rufa TaxID=165716 RepID=A0A7J0F6F7_9ERIC|nr:nodulin MtN21 /EamA-like transporter family protein [Actinidia rufa]
MLSDSTSEFYEFGVVGSVLIIAGLYSVLWGKYREEKEMKQERAMNNEGKTAFTINDSAVVGDIETACGGGGELQKEAADHKLPSIPITLPISHTPTKPNQLA